MLDTIFQDPDQSLTLTKDVFPPPQPEPKFMEIEGFRIQIFAGMGLTTGQ